MGKLAVFGESLSPFLTRRRLALFSAVMFAACQAGDTKVTGPSGQQTQTPDTTRQTIFLTVSPQSATIGAPATVRLTAQLTDTLGNAVTGQTTTWSSSNSAVASVDGSGLVSGLAAGSVDITAHSAGISASASITVDPVAIASIAVTPRTDTLAVGQTLQLTATPKDGTGTTLIGRVIAWSSDNTAAVTVSSTGLVTAITNGVANISATSEGVTGTATITAMVIPVASVTVTPALDTIPVGGNFKFTATPKDAGGNALTGRVITWQSGNTAVATVSSTGYASGVAVGSTSITATSEGQSGNATAVVIMTPVATVTVSPASTSIQTSATKQFSATTRDANGNTLTGRTITWGSNNTGVATVNGTGLATGVAAGSATITATSEGQNGTAGLTVTNPPPVLVRITMTPDTATVNIGATKQFTVTGKYSDSSTAPVTASLSAGGGAITSGGLFTAGQTAGVYKVIATAQSFADTSTVTIYKPPVASVTVTPASDTLNVGQNQQLTAVTKDAIGNVLTGRTITWASSNAAAISVNGSGLVSALNAGSATITATSEGVNGTSSMFSVVVLAATVQVTPATSAVQVGTTTQLTATARDANGNILSGHSVTWTSLSTTIATVNGSGLVSGVLAGSTSIQATVDTAKGMASMRVDSVTAALPWLVEDFSSYTSTASMLADPRGIYSTGEDVETGQMTLDTSVGYGALKRSMRFDFPDRTASGGSGTSGRCSDYTIGRNIKFPTNVTEVWVEVVAKYSNGFTTVAPSSWGCTSAAAYKLVFGRTPTGRYNLVIGIFGTSYTFGWPANQEPADFSMPFTPFDGQWHVYRMHFKVSTPAGSSSANGACELWVDGVLTKSFTGIVETNPYLYGLAIGRNMNQGPGQPESEWWGKITVWNSNPGW